MQTPTLHTHALPPQANLPPTPAALQTSPKKAPPKSVIKALPTERDHTTTDLSPEGDEYVPRERDEAGEQKVSPTGAPLGGREYKCRTFFVPHRGDKLFMLATECARVLGYRDSYLLFNKNRSLCKIIASQPEKDDLIHQEILPYSYRSRQIAIVTARSMFRQFGSRVIHDGRRVRDDYWEAKARKQGFTEEDLAGEKRPGAGKARESAAAEAASAAGMPHPGIVYGNSGPLDDHGGPPGMPPGYPPHFSTTLAPLPMIHSAPTAEDLRLRTEYGNAPRPRQDITNALYQDRTQPTPAGEIEHQARNVRAYSKEINDRRRSRQAPLLDTWNKKHLPADPTSQPLSESSPAVSQPHQSPQSASNPAMSPPQQPMPANYQAAHVVSPQAYAQQPPPPNPIAQSPRGGPPPPMRPDQIHRRSSGMTYGSTPNPQSSSYPYQQSPAHLWGAPPQAQQSPISSHPGIPQYSPTHPQSMHPPPSPHTPQLQSSQGSMAYQQMPTQYSPMSNAQRSMYQQPTPSPQQYMQQTTGGGQPNMPVWAPPSGPGGGAQNWGSY